MKRINPVDYGLRFQLVENEVHERHVIDFLSMSDTDDPEVYAAQILIGWTNTEKGEWCMKNGFDPSYSIQEDYASMTYKIGIIMYFTPKKWTEYLLRFA